MIEQAERVERVADDLCDSPGCDEQQHAVLTLNLQTQRMMGGGQRGTDGLASCCGSYAAVG